TTGGGESQGSSCTCRDSAAQIGGGREARGHVGTRAHAQLVRSYRRLMGNKQKPAECGLLFCGALGISVRGRLQRSDEARQRVIGRPPSGKCFEVDAKIV